MNGYIHPVVIRTYSIAELREDAASCMAYLISDRDLKREIELVEQPLDQLHAIS
jgi:hypothetical protein